MDKKMEYTTIQTSEGEVDVVTREIAEQAIAEADIDSLFSGAWHGAEECEKDGDEGFTGLAILDLERGCIVNGSKLEDGSTLWHHYNVYKSRAAKVIVYDVPQDIYDETHPEIYEIDEENAESEMIGIRQKVMEELDRIYGKKA